MTGGLPIVPNRLSLVLANNTAEILRLVEAVDAFTQAQGVPPDAAYAITLCLDEMAANSIRHAYGQDKEGEVFVELVIRDHELLGTVIDHGPPFNPLEAEAPNLELPIDDRGVGGLGIHIVRTMMDEVTYARTDDRNVVMIRKTLEPRES
jgi:anti-sigma regulatory factor (Ser/Thr protein kinase)